MASAISFELNGKPVSLRTDTDRTLLWVLRTDLGLTGPKYGCGEGICGACTVLVDGTPVRSCRAALSSVSGRRVMTIEGLAKNGVLHPLQQAFIDHGAFQCGYCIPGMLLTAHGLLEQSPHPTRADIIAGLDGNLCRCGAHQRIVAAVEDVAKAPGGRS